MQYAQNRHVNEQKSAFFVSCKMFKKCSKIVENNSATIVGYACLIDRSNGKSAIKEKIVSQVKLDIPTYTEKNLPKNLLTLKAIKPGSRNL